MSESTSLIYRSIPSVTAFDTQEALELYEGNRLSLSIGQPNLSSYWVVNFVTINYDKQRIKNGTINAVTFKLIGTLFEGSAVFAEATGPTITIPAKTEPAKIVLNEPYVLSYQFPQTQRVAGGQSLSMNLEIGEILTKGFNPPHVECELLKGFISVGYTLVNPNER